jgi:2-methylcitrate dehydratase
MDHTRQQVAEHVIARRETPLSDAARHAVRLHLTDSMACAAGGFDSPPARIAASLARSAAGRPGSRVLFHGTDTGVDLAAFSNGIMIRYLDYNDAGPGGHPSDTMGALVALADAHHVSGQRLANAIVIAYDVMMAVGPGLAARDHGFDQGIAVGAAVAAAGTALLGGTVDDVGNAISLAIVPCVPLHQTRVGELSMWKGAATPAAARSGIFAAQLAMAGMTGPAEPFEGKDGLFNRVTGPYRVTLPAEDTTAIELSHFKLRPAEFQSQAILDVVEQVAAGVDTSAIERVEIATYDFAYTEIADAAKWRPATRETADHSLPFLIATTLRYGRVGLDHFSDTHVGDPQTRALMDRISVREEPEFTALYPPVMRTQLDFTLRDGRVITETTGFPRGHRANPATEQDIEQKFHSVCERVAPVSWVTRAYENCMRLPELANSAELVTTFTTEFHAAKGSA